MDGQLLLFFSPSLAMEETRYVGQPVFTRGPPLVAVRCCLYSRGFLPHTLQMLYILLILIDTGVGGFLDISLLICSAF